MCVVAKRKGDGRKGLQGACFYVAVWRRALAVCLSAQTPNIEGDKLPPDSYLLVLVSGYCLTFCLSSSPQITPGGLREGKHNQWEKYGDTQLVIVRSLHLFPPLWLGFPSPSLASTCTVPWKSICSLKLFLFLLHFPTSIPKWAPYGVNEDNGMGPRRFCPWFSWWSYISDFSYPCKWLCRIPLFLHFQLFLSHWSGYIYGLKSLKLHNI